MNPKVGLRDQLSARTHATAVALCNTRRPQIKNAPTFIGALGLCGVGALAPRPRYWHYVPMLAVVHPVERIEGFPLIPRFGYQGSKAKLTRRIAQLFPVAGARFIEPSCGRAQVVLAVALL